MEGYLPGGAGGGAVAGGLVAPPGHGPRQEEGGISTELMM